MKTLIWVLKGVLYRIALILEVIYSAKICQNVYMFYSIWTTYHVNNITTTTAAATVAAAAILH
jgi:hypothetical protein